MSNFSDIKQSLREKGFMPTEVSINGNLNAFIIKSGYALFLYNQLKNFGSDVAFDEAEDIVIVYDEPNKFFKFLEKL